MALKSIKQPLAKKSLRTEAPASRNGPIKSMRSAHFDPFSIHGNIAPLVEGASSSPRLMNVPNAGPNSINTRIEQMRARSRWFYLNDPFYRQACQQVANNVVHYGIKPNIKHPVLRKIWKKWIREADARGRMDFYGLQWLMGVCIPRDGDAIIRFRDRRPGDMKSGINFQLQLLEPDYMPLEKNEQSVSGNLIIAGVERDRIERPVRYWLYDYHPREWQLSGKNNYTAKPVDAADVLHVYMPDRFSDTRGYPWAISAINTVERLRTYDEAELERKIGQSTFGGFFKKPRLSGDEKNPLVGDNQPDQIPGLDPNSWLQLPEDWDVELVSPAANDANYPSYRREGLSGLAVAIGFSVEMINLNFDKINDRIYRAMMLEVTRKIESLQYHMMEQQVCQPVWERLVDEAYLNGLFEPEEGKAVEDYYEVEWIAPARGHINPLQEIQAYATSVEKGFQSRKRISSKFGEDVEEIDEENAVDQERSRKKGLGYTVYFPIPVSDQAPDDDEDEDANSYPTKAA
ncbi:phage portal protein [Rhizobium leguminosarum]|uniref:phage portal protein n=1 Tax=Rhizobium leguminosarum TaxID=384 RepID=UPI001C98DE08|nr:phage portal protein [Rhizobium leguminosarum]MBY5684834.1 phage portal protein [Rhizobium leguminosarum]